MCKEDTLNRLGQVSEYMGRSSKELSKLHDRIDSLIDRLSNILRTDTPAETASDEASELVPLAFSIREFELTVYSARGKIESILERLEL